MMKTNIFNTTFEISLRIILLLDAFDSPKNLDMLYAADFISTYGAEFGVSEDNLNGDNLYKFCEVSTRRELVRGAIQNLVLTGMVYPEQKKEGFEYVITKNGRLYCQLLDSEYANEYRNIAKDVVAYVAGKTERSIVAYINDLAAKSLRGGNLL